MSLPSRSIAIALLVSTLTISACVTTPTSEAPRFSGARPERALEIHLVFGDGADLDLFVTDPNQEAVYFGNNGITHFTGRYLFAAI